MATYNKKLVDKDGNIINPETTIAMVDDLSDKLDNIEKISAPLFDTSIAYSAGDYVVYGDVLYKFSADHAAGAWTGSDVSQVSVSGEITELDETKSDLSLIANEFSASTNYIAGEYVIYQGQLYKFNSDHTAGAWIGTDADAVTVAHEFDSVGSTKADLALIAPEFSTTTAYTAGQYVTRDGILYKFTENHNAGVWIGSDVSPAVVGNVLTGLNEDVEELSETKTDLDVISEEFKNNVAYNAGDYVVHNGKLYVCNEDIAAGNWDSSKWTEITIDSELSDINSYLDDLFSMVSGIEDSTTASKDYTIGDILIYDGSLYNVTANISSGGTLVIDTNIEETTVGTEIEKIKAILYITDTDDSNKKYKVTSTIENGHIVEHYEEV